MKDFSFVHAADLHLDTPFEGVSEVHPELGSMLRDASLDAFDHLVAKTIAARASFLLLSGDIYDGEERGVRAQLRFLKGLETLDEHGIRVFVAHGNHDPLGGWSAISRWPDNVHIFSSAQVEALPYEADSERLATIYGISYASREMSENLSRRFKKIDAAGLHLGVLHCNVGSNSQHEAYAPCTLEDLRAAQMDYWALGHIHQRQVLQEGSPCSSPPWVVYPGNTQGRSFKPSECGEKGAYVVRVSGGQIAGAEFFSTDSVRFFNVSVNLDAVDGLEHLRPRIQQRIEELKQQSEERVALVRMRLLGRTSLAKELRSRQFIEELLQELRADLLASKPLVWLDSIENHCAPAISLDEIRKRKDFSAALLSLSEHLSASEGELDSFLAAHIAGAGNLAELGNKYLSGSPLESAEAGQELLQAATLKALELLDEDTKR